VITDRQFRHARTDRFDHACAIGHGDPAIGRSHVTGGDREVMVIERACVDPDSNFARARLVRIGQVDQPQSVEPLRAMG